MNATPDQIKNGLNEAQASAVMIAETTFVSGPEYIAAITAIAQAQASRTPANQLKAEEASFAFLVANPEHAMTLINKRIAARSTAKPLCDAAQRALKGQD